MSLPNPTDSNVSVLLDRVGVIEKETRMLLVQVTSKKLEMEQVEEELKAKMGEIANMEHDMINLSSKFEEQKHEKTKLENERLQQEQENTAKAKQLQFSLQLLENKKKEAEQEKIRMDEEMEAFKQAANFTLQGFGKYDQAHAFLEAEEQKKRAARAREEQKAKIEADLLEMKASIQRKAAQIKEIDEAIQRSCATIENLELERTQYTELNEALRQCVLVETILEKAMKDSLCCFCQFEIQQQAQA